MEIRRPFIFCAALAALLGCAAARGQATAELINLGTFGSERVAVDSGRNAIRVGNAVLVRLHKRKQTSEMTATLSEQRLAACNGSWVTEPLQLSLHLDEQWDPAHYEPQARREDVTDQVRSVDFHPLDEKYLPYASALRENMKSICQAAKAEPRNIQIPVHSYTRKLSKTGAATSILTGTFARRGKDLDVWLRETKFELNPVNAVPAVSEVRAVLPESRTATGEYSLIRAAFNCAKRRIGTYQWVEYDENGSERRTDSTPRERLRMQDAVPGSAAEAQLDAVCRIYGRL